MRWPLTILLALSLSCSSAQAALFQFDYSGSQAEGNLDQSYQYMVTGGQWMSVRIDAGGDITQQWGGYGVNMTASDGINRAYDDYTIVLGMTLPGHNVGAFFPEGLVTVGISVFLSHVENFSYTAHFGISAESVTPVLPTPGPIAGAGIAPAILLLGWLAARRSSRWDRTLDKYRRPFVPSHRKHSAKQ
jgi:hypothetical protein